MKRRDFDIEDCLQSENSMKLYTLNNNNGIVVHLTNFGAEITNLFVPDRQGKLADIVLGYDTLLEYKNGNPYFGAICGRYANRIANGKFTINCTEYQLPINNGPNHLHGGQYGFNNQLFNVSHFGFYEELQFINFKHVSNNGEMGYPGNLTLQVRYSLNDDNEFRINYKTTTDMDTHVNICSHSFFNLADDGTIDILNHELLSNANYYTPVNVLLIPTGEISSVECTPMDFTRPISIGKRINCGFDQLRFGKGYDHNWVLNKKKDILDLAAICYDPSSGKVMEIFTTQPGLQLYTSNWLDGNDIGKNGKVYQKHAALYLETQHFPDSPNQPTFPITLLKSNEVFEHCCIYKFTVK